MFTFYVFKFFEFFLLLFGKKFRKNFFLFLAWIAYHIDKTHRLIIRQNLKFIYGDTLDESRVNYIERYCYKNLLLNFLQMVENRHLNIEDLAKTVTLEPKNIVDIAREQGRPIVFATGHFGRWELGGIVVSELIKPSMIVYKQMNNHLFQDYLNESRERFRITSVEKNGAVKHLMKQLRKGDSIALLIDTNLSKKDGVVVDFFGKPTRTTATTAYLARKTGALIIPIAIVTDDEENFIVKFSEPIEVAQTEDEEADILEATQKQVKAFEVIMKEYPHLWFWCHKRWKTDYPEIYAG
jgi:KDO2-lipid IV(A) lauroyltransferase